VAKEYQLKQDLALSIQSSFRWSLARKRLEFLKDVIALQSVIRSRQARLHFQQLISAATTIQSVYRGFKARKLAEERLKAIVLMQSFVRSGIARRNFLCKRDAAIAIQAVVRGRQVSVDHTLVCRHHW